MYILGDSITGSCWKLYVIIKKLNDKIWLNNKTKFVDNVVVRGSAIMCMKRCVSTSLLIIWDFPGFRKNLLILCRVYQISWIIENLVKFFFSLSSREEVTLHYNYVYNEKIKQFSLKGWLYLGIFYFVWIICVQILNLSLYMYKAVLNY